VGELDFLNRGFQVRVRVRVSERGRGYREEGRVEGRG
jgi:hypothetical protein